MDYLKNGDKEVFSLVKEEEKRLSEKITLIASENYVSKAVLEASGSVFTNKYSEGYIGTRYYEGQQVIDKLEALAIERAKKLFGAEHVNVQPYSGSPANAAVYLAFLKPGDTILGMALSHGGHLTHGSKASISGKYFNSIFYEIDKDSGKINYEEIRELALKNKPKIIIAGYSAYPGILDFKKFREIADASGSILLTDMSHFAGLVAGGVYPSPVEYSDVVTTTTHKTLRGPRSAIILCKEKYAKKIDKAVFPGVQGGPHDHITAAKAVAFGEALKPDFSEYSRQIVKNAKVLASCLIDKGYNLITNGTETHLILIDLRNKNVKGKSAAKALDKAGIVTNYNSVPYDDCKPNDPSGLRLGTAAVTSRGFTEKEMTKLGEYLDYIISDCENEVKQKEILGKINKLCIDFPIPDSY